MSLKHIPLGYVTVAQMCAVSCFLGDSDSPIYNRENAMWMMEPSHSFDPDHEQLVLGGHSNVSFWQQLGVGRLWLWILIFMALVVLSWKSDFCLFRVFVYL